MQSAEYAAQNPGLKELEEAEQRMWNEKHDAAKPLDSALLFVEIERRAKSSSATEEDAKNYAILKSLREKQVEMSELIDSDEAYPGWSTKPLPSSAAALNIDVSRAHWNLS